MGRGGDSGNSEGTLDLGPEAGQGTDGGRGQGGTREGALGRDSRRVEPVSQATPWDPQRSDIVPAPDKSPYNCIWAIKGPFKE